MLFGLFLALLSPQVQFVDVAERAGIRFQHVSGSRDKASLLDTMSGGVAWLDYDGDGHLDLYFVNGGRWSDLAGGSRSVSNALFRNKGDHTFSNETARAGVAGPRWGMGATAADFDNDGKTDLYVCNYGSNTLYRNRGNGTFEDVTSTAGVGGNRWSSSASFADYDRDGDLDLYVVNYVDLDWEKSRSRNCSYRALKVHCGPKGMRGAPDRLYRNNGDGTFADIGAEAGLQPPASFGLGVIWGDYDDDGWQDIYVANDSQANFLFRNRRDGTFEEVALLSGVAFNDDGNAQAGMGIAWGDYDLDGRFDLYVTHFSDDYNTLYKNLGDGIFRDVSYSARLAFSSRQYLGWGTEFFDFDNDGRPDLFVANGHVYPQVDDFQIGTSYLQPKLLYRNLGGGKFEEVSKSMGAALLRPTASRGAAFADFDKDGDIDIAVNNLDGSPQLLLNQGGNLQGNWISLLLRGTRSNRDAVGARVWVETPGQAQVQEVQSGASFQSGHDLRLHFGLGPSTQAQRIRVRWPDGSEQSFEAIGANRRYWLHEGDARIQEEPAVP